MLFELKNEERKYLGLRLVEKSWECIKFNDTIYLYFDKDKLVKKIEITQDSYLEVELNEFTIENRTIILPKTSRGKNKKLNFTALEAMNAVGVYFYYKTRVLIANFTTQTTFYSSDNDSRSFTKGLDGLREWLDWWIKYSTKEDLKKLFEFKNSKRKHCKFKEGDYFIFRVGRRQYGYGRIMLDVYKMKKEIEKGEIEEKHLGLMDLMGKALIVKIYKKISDEIDLNFYELKKCEAILSEQVMDNIFYYGEFEIIGNEVLEPFEMDFPIFYGRAFDGTKRKNVYLQYGLIYLKTEISNNSEEEIFLKKYFCDFGIGFGIHSSINVLLGDGKNIQYNRDLRNIKNIKYKREIFKHFGLDADKNYYENYKIFLGIKK